MADTHAPGTGSAGIDLSQFYQVFFEEAGENLATMEQMLLNLDLAQADDEELNAIFRCAHSVKGGAATFGFADVAELTHQMETLLDKLRRHELEPQTRMVDVLLAAGDALKAQLARHQGAGGAEVDTRALIADIEELAAGGGAAAPMTAASVPAGAPVNAAAPTAEPGERLLELTVGPLPEPAAADNLLELFKEIAELGTMEPLDAGHSADGMRRFKIATQSSDADLLDLFTFHVPRESLKLGPLTRGYGFHRNAPGAPKEEPDDQGYGFFADAPGAPKAAAPVSAAARADTARAPAPARPADRATPESSTLRVSVDKVDQLINLVGELVITQAMLAQTSSQLDANQHQQLTAGLADLQRNTRDLQEAVMSIRMIPMSVIFNRYPRMLRDLTAKLGKKVELVTQGEATELDKGLVEKITDPLTHLVRNSCDHGIELPDERIAMGKPAHGTITLAASHQGGSILIEVRDDGRGLSRAKLLAKARERGIDAPDALSDTEVWNLIFAPGFSTAEVVTDVSGRGVGMDVVKKNITALNGSVEIDSAEGYGLSVKVRLPLTLAIMDGMSIGVGTECYILPLSSVVESFQVEPGMIRTVGMANRVVQVREQYMPVIDLEGVFAVPRPAEHDGNGIMVIVEAEGSRVALLVDELLGQQQVVVKNLESNYRKVANVSGATIMGDGRVALILDVGALVRLSRH
ncbi:MAG TPA: chemotaxis protein CheA [Burkholderiaceae bacterium]|nr:chemotaxis protein CheA [Burkholderiaceae bacterium]